MKGFSFTNESRQLVFSSTLYRRDVPMSDCGAAAGRQAAPGCMSDMEGGGPTPMRNSQNG